MTINYLASTLIVITSMFGACSDNTPWKGKANQETVAETATATPEPTNATPKERGAKAYDATTDQIEGTWRCNSATLEINRLDNCTEITIERKSTEGIHTWKYRCQTENNRLLTCNGNGTKTSISNVLKAGGKEYEEVQKVEYKDGNATFKFHNDGTLEWIDSKESLGDGLEFVKDN